MLFEIIIYKIADSKSQEKKSIKIITGMLNFNAKKKIMINLQKIKDQL